MSRTIIRQYGGLVLEEINLPGTSHSGYILRGLPIPGGTMSFETRKTAIDAFNAAAKRYFSLGIR